MVGGMFLFYRRRVANGQNEFKGVLGGLSFCIDVTLAALNLKSFRDSFVKENVPCRHHIIG